MPTIPGKSKRQIGYRVPPDLEKKFNDAIESGEFSSHTDLITAALRRYFNQEDFEDLIETKVRAAIQAFLESEEGKEMVRMAMKDE